MTPVPEPARFLTSSKRLALARKSIFKGRFKGMTIAQSNLIRQKLTGSIIKGISYEDVIDALKKIGKMEDPQARAIVRTEAHEIRTNLREASFRVGDPQGTNLYRWTGPLDSRTTILCKSIMAKTSNGVTIERLKEIIRHEAKKFLPDWEVRDWSPHPMCRHSFIRVFK